MSMSGGGESVECTPRSNAHDESRKYGGNLKERSGRNVIE
jgi:hypothetical protein